MSRADKVFDCSSYLDKILLVRLQRRFLRQRHAGHPRQYSADHDLCRKLPPRLIEDGAAAALYDRCWWRMIRTMIVVIVLLLLVVLVRWAGWR
jgi:hypothetical protein